MITFFEPELGEVVSAIVPEQYHATRLQVAAESLYGGCHSGGLMVGGWMGVDWWVGGLVDWIGGGCVVGWVSWWIGLVVGVLLGG